MSDYFKKRLERIHDVVPLIDVLYAYGYRVVKDGGDREQQFPCDLHGDGSDGTASARYYGQSNSFYCFGCGKPWDAVDLVSIKEGISFAQACSFLEKKYNLPPLADLEDLSQNPQKLVQDALFKNVSFDETADQVAYFLETLTKERDYPLEKTLWLWECFDFCSQRVRKNVWDTKKGTLFLMKLKEKVLRHD